MPVRPLESIIEEYYRKVYGTREEIKKRLSKERITLTDWSKKDRDWLRNDRAFIRQEAVRRKIPAENVERIHMKMREQFGITDSDFRS